ncbi:cytochrome oxidase subunit III [Desulfopila sp. IMCC35006]|nr:cytochrome oxidase subunit III [Desulfopila sp. IMCC35006]
MQHRVKRGKTKLYHLYGWILFIICALLFMIESIINWKPLSLAGSVIFLVACLLFLIPLIDSLKKDKDE